MAVQQIGKQAPGLAIGLASDTKPTMAAGSTFIELDTQLVYTTDGSTWYASANLDVNDLLTRFGEVQASPTANTLLARTKNIEDSINVLDDWDESDRAKVNVIAGQAGITGGAGAVAANTPRATLASDDPAVTALQVLDDWDESDRAKVNLVVGQAGITAGAGAVAANTPRATLASDDPAVASLQIIDDWDESDRAKINPIVGQAGVQGGSGAATATTQRVVLATDVALPAGANLVGRVSASHETNTIYDGTTALVPKFAIIDVAASGDNTIVSAVVGKKIRVLNIVLVASAAVTVRFESGAGGTALTGQMQLAANGGFAPGYCPVGHFETAVNTLLNLELSGATSVDGWIVYVEV